MATHSTNIKTVFVTGAGGYIGGSVAVELARAGYAVSGLIRRAEQSAALHALNIRPVVGTLEDADILRREAHAADAVINAASADNRGAVETLLEALKGSGKFFCHTSGSSIVGDVSAGERGEARVFDEAALGEPLPHKRARVAIDRLVLNAPSTHGPLRTAVMCPCLIYGRGGVPNAHSVQLPRLISQARKSGVVRHIGSGQNIWSNVHIDDVASAYRIALEKAPDGSFWFLESGEASFVDVAGALADALKLKRPQPWSLAEAQAEWGVGMAEATLGSNSRIRGKRAREHGWKPTHTSVTEWIRNHMIEEGE